MPEPVLTDMKPRLEEAGRRTADARDRWDAERELRDQLVVAAVDHGMSQRAVATALGVSVTRVSAILLAADD